MEIFEEDTWHKSHVMWHLPPSACVHVTHGTWKMESQCKESGEVSSFWDQIAYEKNKRKEKKKK